MPSFPPDPPLSSEQSSDHLRCHTLDVSLEPGRLVVAQKLLVGALEIKAGKPQRAAVARASPGLTGPRDSCCGWSGPRVSYHSSEGSKASRTPRFDRSA